MSATPRFSYHEILTPTLLSIPAERTDAPRIPAPQLRPEVSEQAPSGRGQVRELVLPPALAASYGERQHNAETATTQNGTGNARGFANCQRGFLTVTGGLKHRFVDQILRDRWAALCRTHDGIGDRRTAVCVRITVGTDGIRFKGENTLPKALVEALRRWLSALRFGPGSAGVTFDIVLG